ncbi:hypothetical protein C2845_PM14G16360 [Panicum miliaceum]|uniref:F-box/LRR-repeat protein 15/At3g58940/PEG3-like LRR domain-containing protein n=1 Tax=Panicum miliaceum TaxID=4540 RepID=A0A3L6PQB5_PANMI|nr:hypothetical protein C2845_PM14G16360 [Panicum miliaceum]
MAWNYFHDWLLCLSRRGVRDLTLGFPSRFGIFRLHSCFFSCRELTCLSLISCRIPPASAGLVGFPKLKTLRLEKVFVAAQEHAGREFAALIAASPVLEDVEMVCVMLDGDGPDDEWVIRAPNLRKLSILGGFDYGGVTESLPLLEEAIFFGSNCAKFLTEMVGITKLDFSFISIWVVTEIAEYPRASSDAQVVFMGREPESANDECRGFITAEDSDDEISIDKARPRRCQRLKSESVAQVEQLREELQNLENKTEQVLKDRLRLNKEISVLYKDLNKYVSYNNSALQLLRKGCNVACPDLDRSASRRAATRASSSDHAGTSKQGTPVDTATDDSHVDHPENHVVGDPGNVHMESPGDLINCADDAHPKSPEDHD